MKFIDILEPIIENEKFKYLELFNIRMFANPNPMLMKKLIFIAILIVSTTTTAQVGINTTDPQSTLDITAKNTGTPESTDGILIPRISNFPTTNPGTNQQSMLVYLTTNRTNININGTPQDYDLGFYYWDNTVTNWIPFTGDAGWRTNGNDDAISGTNFIGTTNNQEVDFRVNNKFVSRLTELGQFELQSDAVSYTHLTLPTILLV